MHPPPPPASSRKSGLHVGCHLELSPCVQSCPFNQSYNSNWYGWFKNSVNPSCFLFFSLTKICFWIFVHHVAYLCIGEDSFNEIYISRIQSYPQSKICKFAHNFLSFMIIFLIVHVNTRTLLFKYDFTFLRFLGAFVYFEDKISDRLFEDCRYLHVRFI